MTPINEHRFWAFIRPHFPFAWRMEDRLAVGRPDTLYRLDLSGCHDTGVLELKMHPKPGKKFWSGLSAPQAASLRGWAKFNRGHAHMLMGAGGLWFLYAVASPVVLDHAKSRTLEEFNDLARNKGEISEDGIKKLVYYLEEVHMGRTT